jgi:hypothetical protein
MLNGSAQWSDDAVERQRANVERNIVRRAGLRWSQRPPRRSFRHSHGGRVCPAQMPRRLFLASCSAPM